MTKLHWPAVILSSRIALALKSTGIIAATFMVFHRRLALLFSEAMQQETTGYILAVPFILAFLIYRKRKMLRTVMVEEEQVPNLHYVSLFWGILLAFIAILLYWYGAYATTGLEYQMFALPLFSAGLCLIVFNSQTLRQLAFPIAFLVFLGTTLLFTGSSRTDIVFQGVRLPGHWVLFSMGTLILFVAYKEFFRSKLFAKRSGCSQCNSLRRLDEVFCRQCGRILRPASARFGRNDIAKLVSIFLALGILLAFQTPFYVLTRGKSELMINTSTGEYVSGQVFPNQSQYFLTFLYENLNYEALTKQDLSVNYLYTPVNGSDEQILVSLEMASARSSLRDWETYVLSSSQGGRSRAAKIEADDVALASNPPTIGKFFAFEYTDIGQTQAVLYWNETVNFMTNSTIEQKHVQISLIVLPSGTSELFRVEDALIVLATGIAEYWEPITTYSEATLVVIENGPFLLAAASACFAVTVVYCGAENRIGKRSNQKAIEKLDRVDRDVVKAVHDARQPATIENIARTFGESCSEVMTKEELERRLEELEKTRIIRASVYGLYDEPLRVWKV